MHYKTRTVGVRQQKGLPHGQLQEAAARGKHCLPHAPSPHSLSTPGPPPALSTMPPPRSHLDSSNGLLPTWLPCTLNGITRCNFLKHRAQHFTSSAQTLKSRPQDLTQSRLMTPGLCTTRPWLPWAASLLATLPAQSQPSPLQPATLPPLPRPSCELLPLLVEVCRGLVFLCNTPHDSYLRQLSPYMRSRSSVHPVPS